MIRKTLECFGLLICWAVAGYGILWGMAVVGAYLSGEPHKETHRRSDGKPRWCFICRKKQQFDYVVMSPVFDMENPSWYGPVPSIRCTTCDTVDGDVFPGREREWEDA